MTRIKRPFLSFLIVVFLCTSITYTERESKAAIPLIFLIGVVTASFMAIGAFCEVAGCSNPIPKSVSIAPLPLNATLTTNSSWLSTTATLTPKAANALVVADDAGKSYAVPLLPDAPIIGAAAAAQPGKIGSYNNPSSWTNSSLLFKVRANDLDVWSGISKDGVTHKVTRDWVTAAQLVANVQSTWSTYAVQDVNPYVARFTEVQNPDEDDAAPARATNVEYYVASFGFGVDTTPGTYTYTTSGARTFLQIKVAETQDGVKRFARSTEGYKPDPTDPDWTPAEITAYPDSKPLQFKASDKSVVVSVSPTATGTDINAATQSGSDVRYRDVNLSSTAVPSKVTEIIYTNADAQTVADTGSGSGTGSGSNEITFPSDYAKAGEAATAAKGIDDRLDVLHKDLTTTTPGPSDPTIPTSSDFENGFFKGTFSKLLSWNLPPHTSTCPTTTMNIDFFGSPLNLKMDEQCELLNDPQVSSVAAVSFDVSWLIAALFIVLWA